MKVTEIELGPIGRDEAKELNDKLAAYIPVLLNLINSGKLKPNEYEVAGGGFGDLAKAVEHQQKGTSAGSKVLIELGKAEA